MSMYVDAAEGEVRYMSVKGRDVMLSIKAADRVRDQLFEAE